MFLRILKRFRENKKHEHNLCFIHFVPVDLPYIAWSSRVSSAHRRHHGVTQLLQSVPQLAALTPQQRGKRCSRSMTTEPLSDQHVTQLAAQSLRQPVFRNVQLAALDHATLYVHVQLGGAKS